MEEGKYIYCIIKGIENQNLGTIGINIQTKRGQGVKDTKIDEVSPCYGVGINNQKVNFLPYKDIAAVVSSTPIINFNRLAQKTVTEHIVIHHRVNEAVMKLYDVVPMAFGIIAPSVSEVRCILEKAYLQFKTVLKKVEGRVEFAVQVWWNQKKVLEELVKTDPEIQKLQKEISLKAGVLGIPIKLKLGRLVHQKIETQRKTYVKEIQAFLSSSFRDSTLNKLISSPHHNEVWCGVNDEMLANFSFLVEKNREPKLDRKMQELGRRYEEKLRLKYIGPMPPYSFVNINLGLGNFELVDEARTLLGLGETASFDEIKKTYYTLCHQYHPDKHQDSSEETEEQMKKITQAYNVLENYCESCDEFIGKEEIKKYSFKKEDVENSIIIKN